MASIYCSDMETFHIEEATKHLRRQLRKIDQTEENIRTIWADFRKELSNAVNESMITMPRDVIGRLQVIERRLDSIEAAIEAMSKKPTRKAAK